MRLSQLQERDEMSLGLGILNYYYNTISLEQQGLRITDDDKVVDAEGKQIKPKPKPTERFSNININKLNKDSLNKILNNLNLK